MGCVIDWAAWGTWAAVVVALGITVSDKVAAYFRRRRESKILAIIVLDELASTVIRLEDLHAEINPPDVPAMTYAMVLAATHSTRQELREMGERLTMPVIESVVERLPNINQELGVGLARTLAAIQYVRIGCKDPARTPEGGTFQNVELFIDLFREAVDDALAITRKTISIGGKLTNDG